MKWKVSIYETVQILGISGLDKTPLQEILTEHQINQNDKDYWIYLVTKINASVLISSNIVIQLKYHNNQIDNCRFIVPIGFNLIHNLSTYQYAK